MTGDASASAQRSGLAAVLFWCTVEFVFRDPGKAAVVAHAKRRAWGLSDSDALGLGACSLILTMVALGAAFLWRVRREGLDASDLRYRVNRTSLLAGLAGGAAMLAVLPVVSAVDAVLVPRPGVQEQVVRRILGAHRPALLAAVAGNGILVPIVEEFAWRGYVQGRLIAGWGARTAVPATAVLFAAKHIGIDHSFARTVTLLTTAVTLGVIGYRWGTAASTMTHLIVNLTGTATVIVAAFLL